LPKIRIENSSVICNAAPGETVLLACARSGFILSAPCGGRNRCGKCKVKLLEGRIKGAPPDGEGGVHSCAAVPVTDITISCEGSAELGFDGAPASEDHRYPIRAAVALDIGTTTVSAKLVDLGTSSVVDTVSELNDQRPFGADVMSRICAARNCGAEELFSLINRQTLRILETFQKRWKISEVEKLSVSGNTVMLHLFVNVDPSGMGELPFTPVFLEGKELKGHDLSLPVQDISVLPSIAAFIGADITAGLAALDVLKIAGPSLYVDIGTNGEMAVVNRGKIFCCSTAAGPAFEGAEISCGTGGIKGAISAAELSQGGLSITTIGNAPPVGICGSGLIDAVAIMLKQGTIDETGFLRDTERGFVLAPGVSITARDIRQFQLAKSAILSGIKILCERAGVKTADVQNVFIAGGFGFYINKQNAVAAGIFPKEHLDLITVCGNLSLQGAVENLLDKNFMEKCGQITGRCSVVDLACDPSFAGEFADNMFFTC
jgi:uncharacterized 2Fe-2S/4Fe-4S cluster protein (DUF4445 family)